MRNMDNKLYNFIAGRNFDTINSKNIIYEIIY